MVHFNSVVEPVSILTLPESETVEVGAESVQFSVAANGDNIAYRWSLDGTELDPTNTDKYSGVEGATLTIMNIALTDAGSYTVVVSNVAGSVTVPNTMAIPPETPAILTVCKFLMFIFMFCC